MHSHQGVMLEDPESILWLNGGREVLEKKECGRKNSVKFNQYLEDTGRT